MPCPCVTTLPENYHKVQSIGTNSAEQRVQTLIRNSLWSGSTLFDLISNTELNDMKIV